METKVYDFMNQREGTFWWHVGMQKIIDSQLQKYAPKEKDNVILEAGWGTGGVLNLLANMDVYTVLISRKKLLCTQNPKILPKR